MKKFIVLSAKYWSLLVLGLMIRLVLMPITLHHDIWAISFSQYFFTNKGVLNIYDYLAGFPIESLLVKNYGSNFFTYPPLSYFTLGGFAFLLKPFYSQVFLNNMIANLGRILNEKDLFKHLFLTKFPYLFFDLGILFLLMNYFGEVKKKFFAFIFWFFNPLSFYATYMIGQFDIIPVFFVVLSLILQQRKKLFLAAVSIGIGGAYKIFPLFFLPFLVLSNKDGWVKRVKVAVLGLLPFLATIFPFLKSVAFRQTVLTSEQSQKIFFAKIPVSGAEYLSFFLVGYIVILILSLIKKSNFWQFCLFVLLLLFSVTNYHPQWFLWIIPFLILAVVEYPKLKEMIFILISCWFCLFLIFDPVLPISIFVPIDHNLVRTINLPAEINKFYDIFQLRSFIRSVFAGVSLALFVLLLKENEVS